jgi:hypothetical protein
VILDAPLPEQRGGEGSGRASDSAVPWWGKKKKGFAGAPRLGSCCSDIFWASGKRKGPIERSSGQAEWFHRQDDKEISSNLKKFQPVQPATRQLLQISCKKTKELQICCLACDRSHGHHPNIRVPS